MPVIHITTAQELQDMQDDVTADYALDNDINLTGLIGVLLVQMQLILLDHSMDRTIL